MEPQSTVLFILLMAAFCGLLGWVAVAKQPAVRVLAASLAFVPAMLFGVAAVNKYYDYYQTWGAIAADFGAQGVASAQVAGNVSGEGVGKILSKVAAGKEAAQQGETLRLTVAGRRSHLRRAVYVYLPPEYFQPGYRRYRFPAIELIPGFPGEPQDWIDVVGITQTYQTLLRDGLVKPAVLVMPDANGGIRVSLQCLNVVHGPQDATFLAIDVPQALAASLRLRGPGPDWGIAGYSEGGFCAANLALNYPSRYGLAGVLSGYFVPSDDLLGHPPHNVNPFGRNAALRRRNTPLDRIRSLSLAVRVPRFWLGAGSGSRPDVQAAQAFQQLVLTRQPSVVLRLALGGRHDMATWRDLVPPMLEWMTPRLAAAASHKPGPPRSQPAGSASPRPGAPRGTAVPSPGRFPHPRRSG